MPKCKGPPPESRRRHVLKTAKGLVQKAKIAISDIEFKKEQRSTP